MSSDCDCAWSPVHGWVVCRNCCDSSVSCTHLLEDLEAESADEETP